jgi:hypothetical protein
LDKRALALVKQISMSMKKCSRVMLMEAVFEWDRQRHLSMLSDFEEREDGSLCPIQNVVSVV